jgi:hypothetical protein
MGIEKLQVPEDISIPQSHSLCLFPSVTVKDGSGSIVVIHPRQALFSERVAFALGDYEQQEFEREFEKRQKAMRYGHFRKNSTSSQSQFLSPVSTQSL